MRYKTLFRVLLKLLGVWVFVEGTVAVLGSVGSIVYFFGNTAVRGTGQGWYFAYSAAAPLVQIAIGAYLFLGGQWIADRAIPGNRPYCHECGYDLTNAAGNLCAECGTPFKPAEVVPTK